MLDSEVTADAVEPSLDEAEVLESNETTEDHAPEEPTEQDKVQKRIDKAIYEKHQARRELEQARAEAAELRAKFEAGDQLPPENIQDLVRQEAARMKAEESFNAACNKTYDEGVKEFGPSFDKAMHNLSLVGMSNEFLELVSESDHGAKILAHLGQDLDEAERIARLSPLKMARELTKLDIELGSKKTVKKISSAPEPIKPVSGKSGGNKSPAEMSDAEYRKWRKGR